MEKSLSVHKATLDSTRHLLARVLSRGDTTAGASSIDDLCAEGQPFTVQDGDKNTVAAYVLTVREHAHARVCWVMAAGGDMPGVDLIGRVLDTVEEQAREVQAQQVAITTRRRGLIKKMQARGYQITGVTLRKTI